jgi:hypothetical protein
VFVAVRSCSYVRSGMIKTIVNYRNVEAICLGQYRYPFGRELFETSMCVRGPYVRFHMFDLEVKRNY